MINIIKVQCPHCGVEGQLMLPDTDILIVGPCPECNNTVVIFAGKALPLDTELMSHATKEDAYTHISDVLTKFVGERLDQLFGMVEANETSHTAPESDAAEKTEYQRTRKDAAISSKEVHEFVEEQLPLIDNIKYFKAIFG